MLKLSGRVAATAFAFAALLNAGCTMRGGSSPAPGATGTGEAIEGGDALLGATARTSPEQALPDVQAWSFHGDDGSLITTPHFRIYTTVRSAMLLEELPLYYERCLEHYTSVLGKLPQPEQPLSTYVFGDREQWQRKTREVIPDQAAAFGNLGRGGFTTQGVAILYDIGRRDTFAIAAHEGWHQYTQRTFRHPLPIWLEEGVATYMETIPRADGTFQPARNRERWWALRRAFRDGRLIPLRELLASTPQSFLDDGRDQLLTYYAQTWALTRFLAEGEEGRYRPALEELLADAAHGRVTGRLLSSGSVRLDRRRDVRQQMRRGPAIMLEYFNEDLEQIAAEYERFIAETVRRR